MACGCGLALVVIWAAQDRARWRVRASFDRIVAVRFLGGMLDAMVRPWIDPPLRAAARGLVAAGVEAHIVTLVGAAFGIAAAAMIAVGQPLWGLVFIALSRVADGLDGPVARAAGGASDFGGYLDTVADFVFYAAIPLGFGIADPANAVPAMVLLASFLLSGSSFLAFATLAAKRGLSTEARGRKSFYYAGGLAEGTETIAAFTLACLVPSWFTVIAYVFAALCLITAIGRTMQARDIFRA
jgi:phosphatidylglycerophosphate synthase